MRIEISQDRRTNRRNGDGEVYFKSLDEATEAMKCDRKYMGSRYVELYLDAPHPPPSNSRRSKTPDSPHQSSRSSSKAKTNDRSRSRSIFLLFKKNNNNS